MPSDSGSTFGRDSGSGSGPDAAFIACSEIDDARIRLSRFSGRFIDRCRMSAQAHA